VLPEAGEIHESQIDELDAAILTKLEHVMGCHRTLLESDSPGGKIIGATMLPLQPLRVNHSLGHQPIAHEVFISCARSVQVWWAM
jgi:hypothetical protein